MENNDNSEYPTNETSLKINVSTQNSPNKLQKLTHETNVYLYSYIIENIIKMNSKKCMESEIKKEKDSIRKECEYTNFENYYLYKSISIFDYIKRINHFAKIEQKVLILSMMLLDRFLEINKNFVLSKNNCYKYKILFL